MRPSTAEIMRLTDFLIAEEVRRWEAMNAIGSNGRRMSIAAAAAVGADAVGTAAQAAGAMAAGAVQAAVGVAAVTLDRLSSAR